MNKLCRVGVALTKNSGTLRYVFISSPPTFARQLFQKSKTKKKMHYSQFCQYSTVCAFVFMKTARAPQAHGTLLLSFNPARNCQKCLPNYYGHDCDVHCTDDVTCRGNGQCDASGKCLCEDKYNATADCGNQASVFFFCDPHFSNADNEEHDFHGADASGYYAYTADDVGVTTWHYFCDEKLQKGMTCVERVAILQKSNGDVLGFKRTDRDGDFCQADVVPRVVYEPGLVPSMVLSAACGARHRSTNVVRRWLCWTRLGVSKCFSLCGIWISGIRFSASPFRSTPLFSRSIRLRCAPGRHVVHGMRSVFALRAR